MPASARAWPLFFLVALIAAAPACAQRAYGDPYAGAQQTIRMYSEANRIQNLTNAFNAAAYRAPFQVERQIWQPTFERYSDPGTARSTGSSLNVPRPVEIPMLVPFADKRASRLRTTDGRSVLDEIVRERAPDSNRVPQVDQAWDLFLAKGPATDAAKAVALAQPAADAGNADAMLLLGTAHFLGRGTAADEKRAFDWVSRAAAAKNLEAQTLLGEFFLFGVGVAPGEARALEWFQRAADAGEPHAQLRFAEVLLQSDSPEQDFVKALQYAERAATTLPQANFALGFLLLEGRPGVPENRQRGAAAIAKAAQAGHSISQYLYAVCLSAGYGVQKDLTAAIPWLEKASAQGLSVARLHLGRAYLFGDGVAENHPRALELLQLAAADAEQGAFNAMGLIYSTSSTVPQDPALAFKHFRQGAGQGDHDAELNLGVAYTMGYGVTRDDREAARWLMLSADSGNAVAQYYLGSLYLLGSGVPLDVSQGVRRISAAAASKFTPALNSLCDLSMRERSGMRADSADFTPTLQAGIVEQQPACIYVQAYRVNKGILGPSDPARAVDLLRRAGELGYTRAQLELGQIYLHLVDKADAGQRDEVLAEARHWLKLAADNENAEAARILKEMGWR